MIEHPEAVLLARQLTEHVVGRRIAEAVRGNWPHKFAFYSGEPAWYAERLCEQEVRAAWARGVLIMVAAGDDWVLVLGGGGERITLHPPGAPRPPRHQLLLEFEDGAALSVKVAGWGSCQLWTPDQAANHAWCGSLGWPPSDERFTDDYFLALFEPLADDDVRSIKAFLISDPGVSGMGNGYLHDMLWRARLHPRTRAATLDREQRLALHAAVVRVTHDALAGGGRDDEYDLFGAKGRYARRLCARTVGATCTACGQGVLTKDSFLGGSVYWCPVCQPEPPRPEPRRRRKA
ncbi:MAG: hypothetical protein HZB16_04435 [Armatimonadetes bacterium]|nr:hypothetical protein [Armatimonadota bacterium]